MSEVRRPLDREFGLVIVREARPQHGLIAEAVAQAFEQRGQLRCGVVGVVKEQPLPRAERAEFFGTDENAGDFGGERRAFQPQVEQLQEPARIGGGLEEAEGECVRGRVFGHTSPTRQRGRTVLGPRWCIGLV
jgi:hypothetical protein